MLEYPAKKIIYIQPSKASMSVKCPDHLRPRFNTHPSIFELLDKWAVPSATSLGIEERRAVTLYQWHVLQHYSSSEILDRGYDPSSEDAKHEQELKFLFLLAKTGGQNASCEVPWKFSVGNFFAKFHNFEERCSLKCISKPKRRFTFSSLLSHYGSIAMSQRLNLTTFEHKMRYIYATRVHAVKMPSIPDNPKYTIYQEKQDLLSHRESKEYIRLLPDPEQIALAHELCTLVEKTAIIFKTTDDFRIGRKRLPNGEHRHYFVVHNCDPRGAFYIYDSRMSDDPNKIVHNPAKLHMFAVIRAYSCLIDLNNTPTFRSSTFSRAVKDNGNIYRESVCRYEQVLFKPRCIALQLEEKSFDDELLNTEFVHSYERENTGFSYTLEELKERARSASSKKEKK